MELELLKALMRAGTEGIVEDLLAEIRERVHEIAILMNDFHVYPWCCKRAGSSNGWHQGSDCKNWVMVY